jgi:hypothetical protein
LRSLCSWKQVRTSLISPLQYVHYVLNGPAQPININSQSQYFFLSVSPVLYETVVLHSAEQCVVTLAMLQRRLDIARHVRELVIRPQSKYHHFGPSDNHVVSSVVRQVASSMCLDALVKFQWDAEEMPFLEDMWFALRLGCVSKLS